MLARLKSLDGPFAMHRVGQWIVDDFDLGIGDHIFVGRQHSRYVIGLREFAGASLITRRDYDHLCFRHMLAGQRQRVGCDTRGAENSEFDGI